MWQRYAASLRGRDRRNDESLTPKHADYNTVSHTTFHFYVAKYNYYKKCIEMCKMKKKQWNYQRSNWNIIWPVTNTAITWMV